MRVNAYSQTPIRCRYFLRHLRILDELNNISYFEELTICQGKTVISKTVDKLITCSARRKWVLLKNMEEQRMEMGTAAWAGWDADCKLNGGMERLTEKMRLGVRSKGSVGLPTWRSGWAHTWLWVSRAQTLAEVVPIASEEQQVGQGAWEGMSKRKSAEGDQKESGSCRPLGSCEVSCFYSTCHSRSLSTKECNTLKV